MKKIATFLILALAAKAQAMESLINPESSSPSKKTLCQRFCNCLGLGFLFQSKKTALLPKRNLESSQNSLSLSLVEMMDNLSLETSHTIPSPMMSFSKTCIWYHLLRFLAPKDLLALSQTHSQFLKSIQSAPAFNHQSYFQKRNISFLESNLRLPNLVLTHTQTKDLLQSVLVKKREQFSIAKGCSNLTPVIVDYKNLLKILNSSEKIDQLIHSTNVFLIGGKTLLYQNKLHHRTSAIITSDKNIIPVLNFDHLKHTSFCIRTNNFDEKTLQALQALPCLTHLSITHLENPRNPENFFIDHLPQMRKSWSYLQSFIYQIWNSSSLFNIQIPQNVMKNILSELMRYAPCLNQLEFPSHALEEAESISHEIQSLKYLKSIRFRSAKSAGFSILDFLPPDIQEVQIPFQYGAEEDIDFAYEKTVQFLNSHNKLKTCDFDIFPDDRERHFPDLFSGYSNQKNLDTFSCDLSCTGTFCFLTNALKEWPQLTNLRIKVYLDPNRNQNINDFDQLLKAIFEHPSLTKKPIINQSFHSKSSLSGEKNNTIEIFSNNQSFLFYMMEKCPIVNGFYGQPEILGMRDYIHSMISEKSSASSLYGAKIYFTLTWLEPKNQTHFIWLDTQNKLMDFKNLISII